MADLSREDVEDLIRELRDELLRAKDEGIRMIEENYAKSLKRLEDQADSLRKLVGSAPD